MTAWANSTRRTRLPTDWPRIRARVLKAEPQCRTCGAPATDVDHIQPGDDHSPANLQPLCRPCHQAKTIAERPRMPSRRRKPEPHPGLRGGG